MGRTINCSLDWQFNAKGAALGFSGFKMYFSTMPFGDDVVGQAQSQPSTLPAWFGGIKRLKNFVVDGFGDAVAIVLDTDYDLIVCFLGRNGDGGLVGAPLAGAQTHRK